MKAALPLLLLTAIVGCGGAPTSTESTQSVNAQSAREESALETTTRVPEPGVAASTTPASGTTCRVVVSMTTVSFGSSHGMTLDQLRATALSFAAEHQGDVGGPSCVVAPAPDTAYGRMIEVMDVLIQSGIPNLSLAVDPSHASESDR